MSNINEYEGIMRRMKGYLDSMKTNSKNVIVSSQFVLSAIASVAVAGIVSSTTSSSVIIKEYPSNLSRYMSNISKGGTLSIFSFYCLLLWRSASKEIDEELRASWDIIRSGRKSIWQVLKSVSCDCYAMNRGRWIDR